MGLVHRVGWDPELCRRSRWFWPLSAAAAHLAALHDWPSLQDYTRVYRACTLDQDVAALTFCENVRKQDKRADGRVVLSALYDARITLAQLVPTRERNWHDLLNMLCFATFPHSKLALHARQYARLAERIDPGAPRLPNRRTPEQDALTLFDEGGVVLALAPGAALQLRAAASADRETLSLQLQAAGQLRVVPFGHALYEHLIEGLRCPGGCTQSVVLPELWTETPTFLRALDRQLAEHVQSPEQLQSPDACGQIKLSAFAL